MRKWYSFACEICISLFTVHNNIAVQHNNIAVQHSDSKRNTKNFHNIAAQRNTVKQSAAREFSQRTTMQHIATQRCVASCRVSHRAGAIRKTQHNTHILVLSTKFDVTRFSRRMAEFSHCTKMQHTAVSCTIRMHTELQHGKGKIQRIPSVSFCAFFLFKHSNLNLEHIDAQTYTHTHAYTHTHT